MITFRHPAAGLAAILLMAGCAAAPPSPQPDAKTEMIGLSKAELFTCMGQPAQKSAAGRVETWSYVYGDCTAMLTIGEDGRVKLVAYDVKPAKATGWLGHIPTKAEQCAHVPEVASCARWLRR
jgi:hypothetical protein